MQCRKRVEGREGALNLTHCKQARLRYTPPMSRLYQVSRAMGIDSQG